MVKSKELVSVTLRDTDKAYLAGIVDGEGCISISKQIIKRTPTPVYSLIVVVSLVNKDVLQYFKEITGLGSVKYGAKHESSDNSRTSYQWWVSSRQAEKLLVEIYPYLRIKREQADIALSFMKTYQLKYYGKTKTGIKGGCRTPAEIVHQRDRYKNALTMLKGYKTKRGRPKLNSIEVYDATN